MDINVIAKASRIGGRKSPEDIAKIKMRLRVYPQLRSNKDEVRFLVSPHKTNTQGFGYIKRKSKQIELLVCPVCEVENYAVAVKFGICHHCGFNANKHRYITL